MDESTPPDMSHMPVNFTETPYFVVLVIVLIVAAAVLAKMAFSHEDSEYKHKIDE